MGNYLKLFKDRAEYNGATTKPGIAHLIDDIQLEYDACALNPFNGHDYVDLGLPSGTLWATMNVGAENETDYGDYYMYGNGAKKYKKNDSYGGGLENPLSASADTATQVWGCNWHMPTKEQCDELVNTAIAREYVSNYKNSGHNGLRITGPNGNVIFFPFAGYYNTRGEFRDGDNSGGRIWASTPGHSSSYAWTIFYSYNGYITGGDDISFGTNDNSRNFGYSIRPVVG